MSSDKDNKDLIVSVSGKKVTVNPEMEALNQLVGNLPSDAAELLARMQAATAHIDIKNISNTSPGLKIEVQKEIAKEEITSQSLVRAVPEELKMVIEQKRIIDDTLNSQDQKVRMMIHESGIALGLVIGKTTKKEVSEIIKNFSKIVCDDSDNDVMFFYSDIGLTVFYNDEMVVREMQFGTTYKGNTSKGLRVGDSIETAVEIYGQPRMKSPKGAIWTKFGVFCQNNMITSIRLMS